MLSFGDGRMLGFFTVLGFGCDCLVSWCRMGEGLSNRCCGESAGSQNTGDKGSKDFFHGRTFQCLK